MGTGVILEKIKHIISINLGVILCLGCFGIAMAQPADTNRTIIEDGRIEKMNSHFGLKVDMNNAYETFKVITQTNDFVLYPNITTVANVGILYRFIRFSVGFAPDFFPGNGDEEIKGKTKSFGFGISTFLRHWFINLAYDKVQGYYLANTVDYQPWVKGDPYVQFPDLVYTGFSGSTGYSLNPGLSIKSLTIQTERQLKSAGSFLAVLYYRYYIMDDQSTPSSGGSTQKSNNLEISLGPGYIYTYVIKEKFYASLGFTPAIGFINTKLTTRYPDGNIKTTQHNWAFRWDGKGAVGYNGPRFFSGVYVSVAGMQYKQENTTAVNHDTRVFYQVFFGMRIKAPRGMNRFFDSLGI